MTRRSETRPVQARATSALESIANTAIGFVVNVGLTILIFPLLGIYVPVTTNITLAIILTGVSILRGYLVRRWFERGGA